MPAKPVDPMKEAMRLHQAGRLAEAEGLYRRILAGRPLFAPALSYLGLLELRSGRPGGLIKLQQAAQLAPEVAIFWLNYGLALDEHGEAEPAEQALRRAVSLDGKLFEAHMALGTNLRRRGRGQAAIAPFRRAVAVAPARPEGHVNLGGALNDAKDFDAAAKVLEQAHRRWPSDPFVNFNLGMVRANENRTAAARERFAAAARQRPGYVLAQWHAALALPVIYERQADIVEWRDRWAEGLTALEASIDLSTADGIAAAFRAVQSGTNFHLHYQGANDRALQERYARLVGRIVAARYPAFVAPISKRQHADRVRVGLMSNFFRQHSIAKTHAGWATRLDRERFDVHVIHTGADRDATSETIAAAVDHFHHRSVVDERFLSFVRGLALDILIYPDLGMEPAYQILAALRLAPVQCNGLGHPITAGFPTIDVALSSARMEPPDADAHYGERLVRLANTGFCYRRPHIDASVHFERGEGAVVYVCAQNLTKLLPEQDELFARIAAGVPGSAFWFVAGQSSVVTGQFSARVATAFRAAGLDPSNRIRMLPRMGQQAFYAMYRAADVALDGHAWSGCNSTYEALACGLPVLTWPGPMMRGRHTMAILQMAGLDYAIADNADSFVELAVRLGMNGDARRNLRAQVDAHAGRVFDDLAPIQDLTQFLLDAVRP